MTDASPRAAPSCDVLVVGAGAAGLAAALYAARAGRSVVVCETATRVGGMAASIEVAGQRVDLGSHRLHRAMSPAVRELVDDLLATDLQPRPRHGRIRLGGRWLGFPLRPLDVVRHARLGLAGGFVRDLLTATWRSPTADTFAEQVRAGPGPTLLHHFYGPYARKLWGLEADQLSGELFRRRVGARSPAAVAGRMLRPANPHRPGFWYPRRGFGQLVETLAAAVVEAGADVRLGEPLLGLRRCGGVWRASTPTTEVETPLVISTIPAQRLLAAAPAAPAHVRRAAGSLAHRAGVLVFLALDRERYTHFDAHYFPEPSVTIARLSEPKNYRDGDDPAGVTVLCAELPATIGDEVWSSPDEDLAGIVSADLARCGLPAVGSPLVKVIRLPNVYPVYDLGFATAQQTVETWAAAQPGLALVGRQALFAHDNTHHALEMGMVAGRLAGGSGGWNPAEWAAARHRFRDHVVED